MQVLRICNASENKVTPWIDSRGEDAEFLQYPTHCAHITLEIIIIYCRWYSKRVTLELRALIQMKLLAIEIVYYYLYI